MPKIKQSACCPECKRMIRWTVPYGGDGSVSLFVWHATEPRGKIRCKGSKSEVREDDEPRKRARAVAAMALQSLPPAWVSSDEVIGRLLKLAFATSHAVGAAELSTRLAIVPLEEYRKLCAELEALDRLPAVPGEDADGWRKAEYILRGRAEIKPNGKTSK